MVALQCQGGSSSSNAVQSGSKSSSKRFQKQVKAVPKGAYDNHGMAGTCQQAAPTAASTARHRRRCHVPTHRTQAPNPPCTNTHTNMHTHRHVQVRPPGRGLGACVRRVERQEPGWPCAVGIVLPGRGWAGSSPPPLGYTTTCTHTLTHTHTQHPSCRSSQQKPHLKFMKRKPADSAVAVMTSTHCSHEMGTTQAMETGM